MKWSDMGTQPRMRCLKVNEPQEDSGWNDNYLCLPADSEYRYVFCGEDDGDDGDDDGDDGDDDGADDDDGDGDNGDNGDGADCGGGNDGGDDDDTVDDLWW